MKLIIDISDDLYNVIKSDEYGLHKGKMYDIIRNGTPLDSVKAEIKDKWNRFDIIRVDTVFRILDNIGNSCNTCKNSDDEFSGECYECVKNIQNHHEPEDGKEEDKEIWCTECPYFEYVVDDTDDSWYWGVKCNKDGHGANPSMYAIQSLHNDCPLKKESEE